MNRYTFCIIFLAVVSLGNPMRVYANEAAGANKGAMEVSPEPASIEYKIGAENVLLIDIYYSKGEKITQKSRVSAAGNITLPIVGEVPVIGLTVSQLQKKLHELLDRGEMVPPQVVVSVEEYSMVTLLGEVRKPGAYQIRGGVSVIDLIAQADGFNESAAPNEVKVLRTGPDGKRSETLVKVYDQMNRGAGEGEGFYLEPGDVVVVPRGMVTIMGEVRRPGSYPTRGRLTVVELIAQAEGFNDAAAVNEIKVLHTDSNGVSSEKLVGVYDIMNTTGKGNENVILSSGDVVIVPKSVVMIMGEVAKPGYYPTRGRLTVLELIALAEGFTKFASRNDVKVVRMNPDGKKTEIAVRAADLMQKGAAAEDMHLLLGGDVVIVP